MPRFNLTPRAKVDLKAIWIYTNTTWGDKQADDYVRLLYERFQWLADNPRMGENRPDIYDGYYSYLHKKHLVFYICRVEEIDIIGIPHKSMDTLNYFDK